jgi:hypothetical protein
MPARLGRYVVRRRIGSGGFATVWLAHDEQLDSPVAVKVLADNWAGDLAVRRRFLEEGRFLRKVESPYVVSVYDAGELDDGRPYLVMSYADQGTLADRLGVEGLTPAQALAVIAQVGAGLQALHRRGVLHRDVKPANVLFRTVEDDGVTAVRAMVADLGLGKALDVSSRLTMIAGTPSFVAPEQARGEPLDARADQYSLAALTYLLLAGRAPYSHTSLAAAAAPGSPPRLGSPERPYADAVDAVVRRGLAVDRDDRWPDVAAFVQALRAALAPALGPDAEPASALPVDPQLTQPGARPSPRPAVLPTASAGDSLADAVGSRRRRPARAAWLAVAAVVALGAGAAGGWVLERSDRGTVTVDDSTGTVSVTVPSTWDRAEATRGWRPPVGGGSSFPAVSVGSAPGWSTARPGGHGVFAGILAGTELPERVPQHPECRHALEPVDATTDGDPSRTAVFTGCPGGVTVERVVQLAANRLLWVQVRSPDRATANAVLDGVETHGI